MLNKVFFGVVGVAVYLYATIWVFNHINPWISIAMFAGLIYLALHKISKLF